MGFPMKAGAGSILTAWMLTLCLAMPAAAQSPTQTPATTPPANANPGTAQDSAQSASPSSDPPDPTGSDDSTLHPPTPPGVKTGSKADVNAIGTRGVGGRGLGDWYSTETKMKIGKHNAMSGGQAATRG